MLRRLGVFFVIEGVGFIVSARFLWAGVHRVCPALVVRPAFKTRREYVPGRYLLHARSALPPSMAVVSSAKTSMFLKVLKAGLTTNT